MIGSVRNMKHSSERRRSPEAITPHRLCWTIEETAEACAVAPSLISKAIKEGKLRACVLSPQTLRVLPEDALEWLHSHRAIQGQQPEAPVQIKASAKPSQKKKAARQKKEPAASEDLSGLEDLDWVLAP